MQGLLGSIAELSEQQEAVDCQLLALDASLAGLAAAIPAMQAAGSSQSHAATACTGRLHCTLRPLGLRSGALHCRAVGDASGSSSQEDELALDVSLRNTSRLPLSGSWSVVVSHQAASNSGSSHGSSTALAEPLGRLPPGADWQRECRLPLSCGLGGHVRLLLCRHANAAGSTSDGSPSDGPGIESGRNIASSILQLHSVQLDALHVMQPGDVWPDGEQRYTWPLADSGQTGDGDGSGRRLHVKLQLQLPSAFTGRNPSAGMLLRQLLRGGLGTQPLLVQGQGTETSIPAFNLLLPAPGLQPVGAAGSAQQEATRDWSSVESSLGTRVSAQLAAAPAFSEQQLLLQVSATASTAAALLVCHRGLCLRIQHIQQAAAAASAAGTLAPWPQLFRSLGTLLPPGIASLGAAAQGGSLVPASSALVQEAELEQAVVQLRQLREAAVLLRSTKARQPAARPASQVQLHRRQEKEELKQLVCAARAAVAHIPINAF